MNKKIQQYQQEINTLKRKMEHEVIKEIQKFCTKYQIFYRNGNGTFIFFTKGGIRKDTIIDIYKHGRKYTRFWNEMTELCELMEDMNDINNFFGSGIDIVP